MCGIVGYTGGKNSAEVLINGLKRLEYRGYDSSGIAVFESGGIRVIKTKGRLSNLEQLIKEKGIPNGNCGIGHTRWATHGQPSDINSHPHSSERVTLVHNGIIENYQQLKSELIEKGYFFESQTDTEVVVKLIDSLYDNDPFAAISNAIARLKGSYALGIIFNDFPGKIFATRKDSPLLIGVCEGENFIASDMPAILNYTRNYYILEEGEIAVISADNVEIFDQKRNPVKKELHKADWDIEAAEKGGFKHFMLKEINDEPKALRDTILPRIKDGIPDSPIENMTLDELKAVKKIHIVACGTAMHAGIVGKYAIEELCRIPVEVDIASEFRYRNPILNKDDLVIIISQSGETADTLAALRLANQEGCNTLAIVNVVGSSIAREAKSTLYTRAGLEIAVASTKAYMVQLSVMYMLAIYFGYIRGNLDIDRTRYLTSKLVEIPDLVSELIKDGAKCEDIAAKLKDNDDLFFIGRGLDYAACIEGSLKLKEISYIHSEAYAAGELKHGTISLITEGTPVIAIATQTKLYEKTLGNIKEVKARGANLLLICRQGQEDIEEYSDYCLRIPNTEDIFTPMLTAVYYQLFAYYMSVLRGCDVDKPRNLAKSVTVE